MGLDEEPGLPGGLKRELPVAHSVNHPHQSALTPPFQNESVPIFLHRRVGSGGHTKVKGAGLDGGIFQRPPSLAGDARPLSTLAPRGDNQVVHKPIDRTQAVTQAAGGRKPIGDGLLDIADPGAIVDGLDLNSGPLAGANGDERQGASTGMFQNVGSQFAHHNHHFFPFPHAEAQGMGHGLARLPGCTHVAVLGNFNGLRRNAFAALHFLNHFLTVTVVPLPTSEWISISSINRFAPGRPRPNPRLVL